MIPSPTCIAHLAQELVALARNGRYDPFLTSVEPRGTSNILALLSARTISSLAHLRISAKNSYNGLKTGRA